MPDLEKVKKIMQFALLTAAQNDDPHERQLGPIHLIKYVYLADMDYAKYDEGHPFTGIDWKFHHFGPWSTTVFQQIDEALASIGAERKSFASRFSNEDCIRWEMDFDEELYAVLRKELPMTVWGSLSNYVAKYRDDTTSLLHFVYATRPMLYAAPGEQLDFSVMPDPPREKREDYTPYMERLSNKKRKKLKQGMEEMRERFRQRAAEKKTEFYAKRSVGAIDAVFEEGVTWLDELAGEQFPEDGVTVHFSNEVWKSEARRGDV